MPQLSARTLCPHSNSCIRMAWQSYPSVVLLWSFTPSAAGEPPHHPPWPRPAAGFRSEIAATGTRQPRASWILAPFASLHLNLQALPALLTLCGTSIWTEPVAAAPFRRRCPRGGAGANSGGASWSPVNTNTKTSISTNIFSSILSPILILPVLPTCEILLLSAYLAVVGFWAGKSRKWWDTGAEALGFWGLGPGSFRDI